MILKTIGSNDNKKNSKSNFNLIPCKTGTSQDEMPFDWVKNGIIKTSDGRYVSIIEVLPINFNKKSLGAQKDIADSFANLFTDSPDKLQIKIANDIVDTGTLIKNIINHTKNITDPKVRESIAQYVNFIRGYASSKTIGTRYFIVYEYEGSSGKFEEIVQNMSDRRKSMIGILADSGNMCVNPSGKDLDEHLKDVLYYFFNRASNFSETRQYRSMRVERDCKAYNKVVSKKQEYKHRIEDDIASKGLYFNHRKHVYMDRFFYSWIGVKGNSYPTQVVLPWMNWFTQGTANDVDIYFNRIPKQAATIGLKGYKKIKEAENSFYNGRRMHDKARKTRDEYQNADIIQLGLENENDIYNFGIVLTVRGASPKQLGDSIRTITKKLSTTGPKVQFTTSDTCCEDYWLMTLPLLYFRKPWKRLRHNVLTSQIASFYPFTNYQFFDPNGAVIGLNKKTQSLISFDMFNTGICDNPHMFISGVTGSGKTTFVEILLERLFFNGVNVYAIIPKKGFQYKQLCDLVGGDFYDMTKSCINIMGILPEKKIDTSAVNEDLVKTNTGSYLTKKIRSIQTFLNMIVDNGRITREITNRIDQILNSLYGSYGITNDNKSIFANLNTRELKKMPTLETLYEAFHVNPELQFLCVYLEPFVYGKYKNFNGQTNIDTTSKFIVFDVNSDAIEEEFLPAILFMCSDYCYGVIKDPSTKNSIVEIDECWALFENQFSCQQLDDMVRLIRGYGGAVVMASQFLKDAKKIGSIGADIIDNCEIKILLKTTNLTDVKDVLHLTDTDCESISKYKRGMGMFVTPNDKIEMEIKVSDYEIERLADNAGNSEG